MAMIDVTAAPSKRQTANSVMHLLDINPGWHIRVGSNWRYRRALPVEEFQLFNADGQFQQVIAEGIARQIINARPELYQPEAKGAHR